MVHFYIDDCLKSAASEEEALTLTQDCTSLCSKGGFRLNKWISNSQVVASIPEEEKAKEITDLDWDQNMQPVESTMVH